MRILKLQTYGCLPEWHILDEDDLTVDEMNYIEDFRNYKTQRTEWNLKPPEKSFRAICGTPISNTYDGSFFYKLSSVERYGKEGNKRICPDCLERFDKIN